MKVTLDALVWLEARSPAESDHDLAAEAAEIVAAVNSPAAWIGEVA